MRTIYSAIYNGLVRLLFGVRMRDINFAFKLCRRQVLDEITLASEGSFIDAELIVRAMRHGHRVVQFGVDYFPRTRGVSTLSSPAVIRKLLLGDADEGGQLQDRVLCAAAARRRGGGGLRRL